MYYQHQASNNTSSIYVAVPTNISYILPSVITIIVIAKRKMKPVDARAIIGCDIRTRNKRSIGIRKIPMIVEITRA
jgi:hypothetical protein